MPVATLRWPARSVGAVRGRALPSSGRHTGLHMLNYGPVSRSAASSERTAAASRQHQQGDSRLGSNAAQRQLVLLRRRLRLIIRRRANSISSMSAGITLSALQNSDSARGGPRRHPSGAMVQATVEPSPATLPPPTRHRHTAAAATAAAAAAATTTSSTTAATAATTTLTTPPGRCWHQGHGAEASFA